MKTIKEVSKLAGVSVRTLQYYDRIGLLKPEARTEVGYRLYSEENLKQLQHILLFKELEFQLKEIREIMNSPGMDRNILLEQQIKLLTLKKEHLENLILFATGIKLIGVDYMDFTAFDTKKIDEYARKAKQSWGNTKVFKEFEQKNARRTGKESALLEQRLMLIFAEFGRLKEQDPAGAEVRALVKKLQDFINEHFYTCSDKILSGLGRMYAGGGEFTKSIDDFAGFGTAAFVNLAIQDYCRKNSL